MPPVANEEISEVQQLISKKLDKGGDAYAGGGSAGLATASGAQKIRDKYYEIDPERYNTKRELFINKNPQVHDKRRTIGDINDVHLGKRSTSNLVNHIKQTDTTTIEDTQNHRKLRIVWFNVVVCTIVHIIGLIGFVSMFTEAKWQTNVFAFLLYIFSAVGVTAGAHRLWAHKAYKATTPLKILLLLLFTISYQGTVFQWVRDHRVHHKYVDTDADPHNSTRGFFFSHIGWLFVKKHPDVNKMGKNVDMTDIESEKMLSFQKKYYVVLVPLLCFVAPTYIALLWDENPWVAFLTAGVFRYLFTIHSIFLVNSAAHKWGTKPYDKDMRPAETKLVSILATGEGFHNYHHTFPWDYRTAELGGYAFNFSRLFIDTFAKIGWAYDLKTVSEELIEKRVKRTGDGTHPLLKLEKHSLLY